MAAASQLLSLFFLLLLPACDAIYCDEDDCYDLLGYHLPFFPSIWLVSCPAQQPMWHRVKQDANASDIKKAYYKLSLKQWVPGPLPRLLPPIRPGDDRLLNFMCCAATRTRIPIRSRGSSSSRSPMLTRSGVDAPVHFYLACISSWAPGCLHHSWCPRSTF